MLAHLTVAVLLLVTCDQATAQGYKAEFAPHEFYNPILEHELCGLNEEGYICDPNRVVGNEIETFQWILADAAKNATKCPCSTYYCENEQGSRGYRIGVALVDKMTLERGLNGELNSPETQAEIFAFKVQKKWQLGRCREDIIIFYSRKDKALAIYGGQTALAKLTPQYRELLVYKVSGRLQKGQVIEALHNLIYDIKLVLNCESKVHDCGVREMFYERSGQQTVTIGVVSLAAIMATLHSLWI